MWIKPVAGGARVRYPYPPFAFLAAEGANVTLDQYWRKRLVRRDVVLCEQPRPQKPKIKEA